PGSSVVSLATGSVTKPAMRRQASGQAVGHRLARVDDVAEQVEALAERAGPRDAGVQRLAADQLFGAEERSVFPSSELVDGHDAGWSSDAMRRTSRRKRARAARAASLSGAWPATVESSLRATSRPTIWSRAALTTLWLPRPSSRSRTYCPGRSAGTSGATSSPATAPPPEPRVVRSAGAMMSPAWPFMARSTSASMSARRSSSRTPLRSSLMRSDSEPAAAAITCAGVTNPACIARAPAMRSRSGGTSAMARSSLGGRAPRRKAPGQGAAPRKRAHHPPLCLRSSWRFPRPSLFAFDLGRLALSEQNQLREHLAGQLDPSVKAQLEKNLGNGATALMLSAGMSRTMALGLVALVVLAGSASAESMTDLKPKIQKLVTVELASMGCAS